MWLGHHSPAFTLATYVHLLPDDLPDPTFFDGITGRTIMEAELPQPPEVRRILQAASRLRSEAADSSSAEPMQGPAAI